MTHFNPRTLDDGVCSYCGATKRSRVLTSRFERLCEPCADVLVGMTMREFLIAMQSFARPLIEANELRMNLAKYHTLPCPHCQNRHRGGRDHCGTAQRKTAREGKRQGA